MNKRIVSIDVGSAYTKIGIRNGLNARATLEAATSVSLDGEETYLIPSVVARAETRHGVRWLIGTNAFEQKPADGIRVFRNWKALLFSEAPASRSFLEATEVAVAFFRELLISLSKKNPDVGQLPVRVAFPSLERSIAMHGVIAGIVQQAGWQADCERPIVSEPEANAVGLLSRGRNATWMPPHFDYRPPPTLSIKMQRMLEPGLSAAFRGMSDAYRFLVTDVGAFTTDFGYVEFDSSFRDDDWNRPTTIQKSVKLGVRQLDERVRQLLRPEVGKYFDSVSVMEWERRKKQLYLGSAQQVLIGGERISFGADFEGEAIQDEIRAFGAEVLEARKEFCREHQIGRIDEEAVTGGGSAIPALRECLVTYAMKSRRRVHDLWDPSEPDQAVAAGAGRMNPQQKDARRAENHRLVRGATALGAASVFFD